MAVPIFEKYGSRYFSNIGRRRASFNTYASTNTFGYFVLLFYFFAQMAELVDALVSGTSDRKIVQVRALFWAQFNFCVFIG